MRSKRTKACEFSQEARTRIWNRDQGCIFCQMNYHMAPEEFTATKDLQIMHFIPRSQGGLGVPENGAVGCIYHHMLLDVVHRVGDHDVVGNVGTDRHDDSEDHARRRGERLFAVAVPEQNRECECEADIDRVAAERFKRHAEGVAAEVGVGGERFGCQERADLKIGERRRAKQTAEDCHKQHEAQPVAGFGFHCLLPPIGWFVLL